MEVNSELDFQQKIETGISVVDFYGTYCPPCRQFAPIFEKVAQDFVGKVSFIKANTEIIPSVAAKYNVRSIPTIIIFKDGVEVERRVGLMNEILFKIWINGIVG